MSTKNKQFFIKSDVKVIDMWGSELSEELILVGIRKNYFKL